MSPLWSDLALARAAIAAADAHDCGDDWGNPKPRQSENQKMSRRPVRRVLHRRSGSLAL
jgi:hypothetical protein